MASRPSPWLPVDFAHPTRAQLASGPHLRTIRATDVDIDLPAVQSSRRRLWERFGESWGWPPDTLTAEQDYGDLHRHELEILRHESFNYALLNRDETALLGCVYIDDVAHDAQDRNRCVAEVSWWVVDDLVSTPVEAELDDFVPRWLAARWPFAAVSYPFGGAPAAPPEPTPLPGQQFDLVRTPLGPVDSAAAHTFWQDYCQAHPDVDRPDLEETAAFGDSVELADELIGLVLRGIKTATAGLRSDYVAEGEPLPQLGGHWIACDGRGAPRAVLQTTELRLGPAASVDRDFAWDEGELDRSRRSWLNGHLGYWQRTGAEQTDAGAPVSDVIFQRFRVSWPEPAAATAAGFTHSVAARSVETTLS